MWVVMSSAARMPQSCWGKYRNVALVQLDQYYTAHNVRPAMISPRARGVLNIQRLGRYHVGSTPRCAYAKAMAAAEQRAQLLNNSIPEAWGELLMSWGGSA